MCAILPKAACSDVYSSNENIWAFAVRYYELSSFFNLINKFVNSIRGVFPSIVAKRPERAEGIHSQLGARESPGALVDFVSSSTVRSLLWCTKAVR